MSDSENPTPPTPPAGAPPPPPSAPPPPHSPPPAGAGPQDHGPRLPWLERERLGFVNAYVETAKLIVQKPAEAFGRIRADGDLVSPLLFGGIAMLAALLVHLIFGLFWGVLFTGSSGMGAMAFAAGIGAFMSVVVLVISPIFFVIGVFLLAAVFHGILMLTGGLEASKTGFEGSVKVVGYASLTTIVGIVPVIGPLLQIAALGYLCYLAIPQVHGCSEREAIYALIPLALCGGCGVVALVVRTVFSVLSIF